MCSKFHFYAEYKHVRVYLTTDSVVLITSCPVFYTTMPIAVLTCVLSLYLYQVRTVFTYSTPVPLRDYAHSHKWAACMRKIVCPMYDNMRSNQSEKDSLKSKWSTGHFTIVQQWILQTLLCRQIGAGTYIIANWVMCGPKPTSIHKIHSNECWLATIYSALQVLIHIVRIISEQVNTGMSIEWRVYAYSTTIFTDVTTPYTGHSCGST